MAGAFQQRGVSVDFLFSGRDKDKYFSMDIFGSYQTRRGLTFASQQGRVSYIKTALNNSLSDVWREIKALDLTQYDVVLNDFEPVSAWAAKRQRVPCIGISHQNAFRYSVPQRGASWVDELVVKRFAPADVQIGLHWYHFEQPILPPIVHTKSGSSENKKEPLEYERPFYLVYLPFEELDDVVELLNRFGNHRFQCFHPSVSKTKQRENITLRPLSFDFFQHALHECEGVLANGGFELPSEALSLGKKLLLKPLEGQFEQQSNVATLEQLGLASAMGSLDPAAVRFWLDEEQSEVVNYPDVASALVDWILAGRWECTAKLRAELWNKVDFPSYITI